MFSDNVNLILWNHVLGWLLIAAYDLLPDLDFVRAFYSGFALLWIYAVWSFSLNFEIVRNHERQNLPLLDVVVF